MEQENIVTCRFNDISEDGDNLAIYHMAIIIGCRGFKGKILKNHDDKASAIGRILLAMASDERESTRYNFVLKRVGTTDPNTYLDDGRPSMNKLLDIVRYIDWLRFSKISERYKQIQKGEDYEKS